MGTGSFSWTKTGWGVNLTTHLFECRAQESVELYLYSHYRLYGLYRAPVFAQGCALPVLSGITQRRKTDYSRKTRTTAGVLRGRYLWTNCGQPIGDAVHMYRELRNRVF